MKKTVSPGVGFNHFEKIRIPFTGLNGYDGNSLRKQGKLYLLVSVEDPLRAEPGNCLLLLPLQFPQRKNRVNVENAQRNSMNRFKGDLRTEEDIDTFLERLLQDLQKAGIDAEVVILPEVGFHLGHNPAILFFDQLRITVYGLRIIMQLDHFGLNPK